MRERERITHFLSEAIIKSLTVSLSLSLFQSYIILVPSHIWVKMEGFKKSYLSKALSRNNFHDLKKVMYKKFSFQHS